MEGIDSSITSIAFSKNAEQILAQTGGGAVGLLNIALQNYNIVARGHTRVGGREWSTKTVRWGGNKNRVVSIRARN